MPRLAEYLQGRARFRPQPGRMHGSFEFIWLGEVSLRQPVVRGEPLLIGLVFSAGDYPAVALRDREDGQVRFEVEVSPSGAPVRCTVTESSGSERLDRRTCEVIMQRATFIPATDGNGPLGGVAHRSVIWRLP